jgi:hypothetical protein
VFFSFLFMPWLPDDTPLVRCKYLYFYWLILWYLSGGESFCCSNSKEGNCFKALLFSIFFGGGLWWL